MMREENWRIGGKARLTGASGCFPGVLEKGMKRKGTGSTGA